MVYSYFHLGWHNLVSLRIRTWIILCLNRRVLWVHHTFTFFILVSPAPMVGSPLSGSRSHANPDSTAWVVAGSDADHWRFMWPARCTFLPFLLSNTFQELGLSYALVFKSKPVIQFLFWSEAKVGNSFQCPSLEPEVLSIGWSRSPVSWPIKYCMSTFSHF